MPEILKPTLQQRLEERLRYYEDLGIRLFYRDRVAGEITSAPPAKPTVPQTRLITVAEEPPLPKRKSEAPAKPSPRFELVVAPNETSLFEAVDKIQDDSLLKIQQDIGPACDRCKLHKARHTIVFGDGSPNARLVFIGEGPGAEEDAQGLPFVGRAGKLLTQMIEAMGLQRKDVYICNVVKCRPPENRTPEPDEVAACSPYLLRQVDAINPKVIVCLGATAAKALLNTTRGITSFRGEWLEWRGRKLMATYHPAYLLRNPPAKAEVWKDLQKVMAELGLQPPKKKSS
ncbi:MAG TPA: uracil-DNA glycosylase [Dongiaceae bacterium]|nr:uracil-DNA glycosylase [Dongiaceae bacterium]